MKALLALAVSAVILGGCATKVTGLKMSEDFVYSNVKNGRIAVAGVTSILEDPDEKKAMAHANMLRTQILEERAAFNVTPAGLIRNKLGAATYQKLITEFNTTGMIAPENVAQLKKAAAGHRYVVFARIESDDVTNNRSENAVTDKEGNEDPNRSTISVIATRNLTGSFQVLDLMKNDVAWSGSISKSRSAQKQYQKTKENGLVSLVKAVKGTEEISEDTKYPFPAPPETQAVLADLFNGFAENLPEEE